MFQLVCDPSGVVVETSLKEVVPVVVNWGDNFDHILHVTLSNILKCAQVCICVEVYQLFVHIQKIEYLKLKFFYLIITNFST